MTVFLVFWAHRFSFTIVLWKKHVLFHSSSEQSAIQQWQFLTDVSGQIIDPIFKGKKIP